MDLRLFLMGREELDILVSAQYLCENSEEEV